MHSTPASDYASVAKIDSAGNVYAGGLRNAPASNSDGSAFVAAWSPTGTPLWTRTFDASLGRAEVPDAIEFDGTGGLYVAGTASGPTFGVNAGFLLHLDASGAITWSIERPPTSNASFGVPLVVDAQGRAIVGDGVPGAGDLAITAYTPAGTVAWQRTYASTMGGVGLVAELSIAPNGEIVAIGTVNATVPNGSAPVLIRLAPNGTLLQALEIVTPEMQSGGGVDVEIDSTGRIFAAVGGVSPGASVASMMLLCFNAQGALQWLRSITGPQQPFGGGSYPADLEIDSFGRALVLGGRAQGGSGVALVMAAFDANGNELWRDVVNDVLGGPSVNLWNHGSHLLLDASGEAIAVGSYGPALADTVSDAFAFSVDSSGAKRFGVAYGFPPLTGGVSLDHGIGAAKGNGPSFVIVGQAQTSSSSTGFDAFIAHFTRTASGFCFGDGAPAACPCGNTSAPVERSGCASSLGVGGRLADLGASSLASDTLRLVGTSMPNAIAIYYQGTIAGAGAVFGDGLACVRGEIIRLGEAANVAGGSQFPPNGGQPISTRGQVNVPGMRVYQAVYRNAASFCTSHTFNTTNGMQVIWTP